uniref:Bifunctional inhibitor/plant lipid transfer protein/seed storage helical domain-containing protein n=2 Tax=Triticum urartu TaxID=4572 RepID=A0A8R7PW55_TRIUA
MHAARPTGPFRRTAAAPTTGGGPISRYIYSRAHIGHTYSTLPPVHSHTPPPPSPQASKHLIMATLRRCSGLLLAVVAVALAAGMAAAQGPAGAPAPAAGFSSECMTAVLNMSDCLPYVESGSKTRHPDTACCPELDGLLQSNPVCLCQLLAGGADSYGISVDYKRAMALPGVCRLTAPPLSACAAFGVPVGPSSAPLTGVSPSATGPQMPENPPSATPSKSKSHAPGRLTGRGLVALAALPLTITAAAMF